LLMMARGSQDLYLAHRGDGWVGGLEA
jgi:hypothetical protein